MGTSPIHYTHPHCLLMTLRLKQGYNALDEYVQFYRNQEEII